MLGRFGYGIFSVDRHEIALDQEIGDVTVYYEKGVGVRRLGDYTEEEGGGGIQCRTDEKSV